MNKEARIAVLVSATIEWLAVKDYFQPESLEKSPFGELFLTIIKHHPVIFLHAGWGKTSAAATTQYAIDRLNPEMIINPGICGGFVGSMQRGQILMPDKIVMYDIIEQLGNPKGAVNLYTTEMDYSWLKRPYPLPVEGGVLATADRDVMPTEISSLMTDLQVKGFDREGVAVAWVASKVYKRRCLILRGVSDLVSEQSGEAYGHNSFFQKSTEKIMMGLCDSLPLWLTCAGY